MKVGITTKCYAIKKLKNNVTESILNDNESAGTCDNYDNFFQYTFITQINKANSYYFLPVQVYRTTPWRNRISV